MAALLGVAAVAVLTNRGPTESTTKSFPLSSTSSQSLPRTSESALLSTSNYNSTLGLLLSLSISNGTVQQGDGISLHIALNNTLATQNNLSPALNSLASFGQASWNLLPCTTYPIGVQVFQGNYALGNLSQYVPPLDLLTPGTGQGCPDRGRAAISFAPLSGNITSPVGWWINKSAASIGYWGHWEGVTPPSFQNGEFSSFQLGIYTVEGEDWWGQVTLLHFQVVPNEHPLDCTTIASNPAFVESDNFSSSAGPLTLEQYYADLQNNTLVLALTTTGNSTLTVSNPYTGSNGFGPFLFSPNSSLAESFQYYSPNGTLGIPAMVFPGECSLVSMHPAYSQLPFTGITLNFEVGNQEQTFTLNG
jgi:hypothetical protein